MYKKYFRLKTRYGTYIFKRDEVIKALERENMGVDGIVLEENDIWELIKKDKVKAQ